MNSNEQFRFGSSSWAVKPELLAAGLFDGKGLHAGAFEGIDLMFENDASTITFGSAGSGKGRDMQVSAIALNAANRNWYIDPRGDITKVVMPSFAHSHAHLRCWNPTGLHDLPTETINPLDILKMSSPRFHADAKLIFSSLIPAPEGSNGRYFELQGASWTECIAKSHVETRGAVSFPELYGVINCIESDANRWADYLEGMLSSSMDSVRRTAGEMLAKQQDSPREFGSIMGEIYAHLNFLDDGMLQASLMRGGASYADTCMSGRPISWAHIFPIEYARTWAPLLRVMFTTQLLYKIRHPGSPRIDMMVDEAGQLGNFETLLQAFTYGRGAGVRAWAIFHDAGQIVRNYGAPALQGFIGSAAMRQFFGVRDYQTAQMISQMLGNETLEYDDTLRQADARRQKMQAAMRIIGSDDPFSAVADYRYNAFAETHRTKQARALMTPDEILAMPDNRQILFIAGKNLRPIYAEKYPYWTRLKPGRYLPNPYHGPQDRITVPGRWGNRTLRVIREAVDPAFRDYPQYSSGTWAYVEGHKPK